MAGGDLAAFRLSQPAAPRHPSSVPEAPGSIMARFGGDLLDGVAAHTLSSIRHDVERNATRQGTEAAAAAVLDGQPLALREGENTVAAMAHDRAALSAFTAGIDNDIRTSAAGIAQRADGDVTAFADHYGAYAEGLLRGVPPSLQASVRLQLHQRQKETLLHVSETALTRQRQAGAVDRWTNLDGIAADYQNAVRAGRDGSDHAARYMGEVDGLVRDGLLSGHEAGNLLNRQADAGKRHAVMGQFERERAGGGLEGAVRFAESFAAAEHAALSPDHKAAIAGEMATVIQGDVAMLERRERQAAKAVADREEATAKEGWSQLQTGALTPAWVQANRRNLSLSEFKALGKAAMEPAAPTDDPLAYADLQATLYNGDPAEAADLAFRYHRAGRLGNETLGSVVRRSRELSRADGPKSPYERNRALIVGKLDPGPMVSDPAGRRRAAEALNEYDERAAGAGGAGAEDYAAWAREIIDRTVFVKLDDSRAELPVPLGVTGRDRALLGRAHIDAAKQRLADDMAANRISRDQAGREAGLLNKWYALLDAEDAAKATAAAKKERK